VKTYATADEWFANCDTWTDEVRALRAVVLETGLHETLKWGQPCYTDRGKNVALVSHRKSGAIVSLMKGALLADPAERLVQPGNAGSGRYLLFTSVAQVVADQALLRQLLVQAIEVERAGLRVEPRPVELVYIDELQVRLAEDPAFRAAFEGLTIGRRRGYNLHFARSANASTRMARIARYTPRILMGKGMLDCVCGHTKKPPGCDGSHRDHPGSRPVT